MYLIIVLIIGVILIVCTYHFEKWAGGYDKKKELDAPRPPIPQPIRRAKP